MSNQFTSSRREFLAGFVAGAGASVAIGGCGHDAPKHQGQSPSTDRPANGSETTRPGPAPDPSPATLKKRLTGVDLDTNRRWHVAGTDLGIPYVIDDESVGFLFGDTFDQATWEGPPTLSDWRSPVLLRSRSHPGDPDGIVFVSAAQVDGDGRTPEIMVDGHLGIGFDGVWEVTVIPNDGITFPETGRQIVSYMSILNWEVVGPAGPRWKTNYAGLAYSDDGNHFTRTLAKWLNDEGNTDPFQMWSMQRDGDWVYVFTVRAGRQDGPMMLQRVPWDRMLDPAAYEGWGRSGSSWSWGVPCSPILEGRFGEPSVRRLADGTWAMAYLDCVSGDIVTRTADGPAGRWSDEKTQIPSADKPYGYGGFIHPWSTLAPGGLHLMMSKWSQDESGRSREYHVSQWAGTL